MSLWGRSRRLHFEFELRDQTIAVERQMMGIAAQETQRVGPTRGRGGLAILKRCEKAGLDAQIGGDLMQILAAREASLPELLADMPHGLRTGLAGSSDFAWHGPASIRSTAVHNTGI